MGTKELGWSTAKFSAVRFLALVLSVSSVAVAPPARAANAVDAKKTRDKVVEYNKQALLSYEAKDFETAKSLLTKAIKESKQAGLDDDKMTARTYLHLGAVYWVGFQDRAQALQNFSLAKKIRPDIQLTPSLETPELKSVFDLVTADGETAPPPAPVKPAPPKPAPVRPQPRAAAAIPVESTGDGDDEPALPATMSAPLMCGVPDAVPPGKDMSIRCALRPGINARVVQLHYRVPGEEAYQVAQMKKTPGGWWMGLLPGHVVKAGTLQVYFDARDGADRELASNGHVDSPSIIAVRKKGSGDGRGGDGDDPMKRIRDEQRDQAYEAGLHRRRKGAVWVGVGFGSGFGYAPAGKLEWRKISVSAVTAPVGMYHLLPEIGGLVTENFALAAQGIIEVIRQDQLKNESQPSSITGEPATLGWALLGRAIFLTDLSGGNLQFSFAGEVGGGYIRIPVAPLRSSNSISSDNGPIADPNGTIYKTDTRLIGTVLAGVSAGFTYHLSRHFALALDGRVLMGGLDFGAMIEGWVSAQIAFGGRAGPAQTVEEGEGEGEGSDNETAPSSDSSSDSSSESSSDSSSDGE
jgi:hypothetical protein